MKIRRAIGGWAIVAGLYFVALLWADSKTGVLRRLPELARAVAAAIPEDDLLAWVLADSNGMPLSRLFCEQLLVRAKPEHAVLWLSDAQGVELAGGLGLSLRDFARLGQQLVDARSSRNRSKIPNWFIEALVAPPALRGAEISGLGKGSERRYGFVRLAGAAQRVALIGSHGTSLYVDFDKRLYRHDIMGSIAHATMLAKVGVLTAEERDAIEAGLKQIQSEIEAGQFDWRVDLEDVHMNIEARLTDRIGVTGKKLHTGRSRNDQVLVDLKLFTRHELKEIVDAVKILFDELIQKSEQYKNVLMPGYTHLQVAMPSSFGLWFGAYAESIATSI
jgi:hypothetical protein